MSRTNETYFIAEIGVNHGGDINLAKNMIKQVANSGAHAAKFQTYKAEKLAHQDSPGYWDQAEEPTASQYKLFKKFDQFEQKDYEILASECRRNGIDFLSTPFDLDCLDWLIPLMPTVKVASADLTNYMLIEGIAKFKKPIILSVGASTDDEITDVLDFAIKELNIPHVTLLHCMLHYPTPPRDAFLSRIQALNEMYASEKVSIGYSDHIRTETANNDQILMAIGLGAKVVEKHYTHDKTLKGNDHYHAVDEVELKNLMGRIKLADTMLSTDNDFKERGIANQAKAISNARRSLFYSMDLTSGSVLNDKSFIAKRPGHGVSPKFIKNIIGKKIRKDILSDQPFSWSDIEDGS